MRPQLVDESHYKPGHLHNEVTCAKLSLLKLIEEGLLQHSFIVAVRRHNRSAAALYIMPPYSCSVAGIFCFLRSVRKKSAYLAAITLALNLFLTSSTPVRPISNRFW